MTDPYGIIDLGALKHPAADGGEIGAHEVAVTEQGLEQLIEDSQTIPTVLVVTSARIPEVGPFLSTLRSAVNAKGGAVRLATVDADTQPRVAQALRVQQLPTVLLLLLGQLQPIAESVIPDEQIPSLLDQVVEVAQQQGMQVAAGDAPEAPAEEPLPPLIQEAYDKIDAGDLNGAASAYEAQLAQAPADAEAKAGLASVRLMQRTAGADLQAVRDAAAQAPQDLAAQLAVADLDMLGGHVDDAFARLLDQLRGADQETKDLVRARLLELFDVVGGEDPRVGAARKRLANLLY